MQSSNKPMQIEIVNTVPFWKKVMMRPFRSYARMGSLTFGLTFIGNFVTTLFDTQRRNFMTEHSQFYTTALLSKSCYFGVLWPSFYLTSLTNPKSVFIIGHGLEKLTDPENYIPTENDQDIIEKTKNKSDGWFIDKMIQNSTVKVNGKVLSNEEKRSYFGLSSKSIKSEKL